MVGSVCTAFDISPQTFETLLAAYFDNMTAYSLFHRPTFDNKMCAITSEKELQALLAAMFSFSVRFVQLKNLPFSPHSQQLCAEKYFAEKLVAECVADCKEDSPSLCVLQAMTINIFISLTNGVRGDRGELLGNVFASPSSCGYTRLIEKMPKVLSLAEGIQVQWSGF